jgi:glycosyltransferase involved in cell wall biosynthesis
MRIALDEQIFAVQSYGGISRLFYEKASAFVRDQELGISLEPLDAPIINEYVLADPELSLHLGVRRAGGPMMALAHYFTRRRRQQHTDIVHNTFYLPRALRDHSTAKRVVTVYDMIPELMPKTRRRMDFLTEKHRYLQRADHIICISESTKTDLLRIYPDVSAPITIAYPGVGPAFHPDVAAIGDFPDSYVLHVGNRAGYKDGETLYRAFSMMADDFPGLTLFLVGGGEPTRAEIDLFEELGISSRVSQRSLSDDQVPAAYAQAALTVFPSRYEGFGLPAVEAMATGSPLVLSHTSSLPEVGGTAARYFPPGDATTLSEVMSSVLSDLSVRREMTNRGFEQVRQFTWSEYALAHSRAYEQTLRGN